MCTACKAPQSGGYERQLLQEVVHQEGVLPARRPSAGPSNDNGQQGATRDTYNPFYIQYLTPPPTWRIRSKPGLRGLASG